MNTAAPKTQDQSAQNKRRTRIQEINRQVILEAALEVFSTYGYRGSTIDQIAGKAGMSKPNLLYYFRRKADIYRAVLESTLATWLDPLEKLNADGDPAEEIAKYIRLKLQMTRDMPEASRLFANEILHGAPIIGGFLAGPMKELVDAKSGVIRQWIADGQLADVDPLHLIFMIWATTQHYADFDVQVRAVLDDSTDRADPLAVAEQTIMTVFFDGLRPR